MGDRAPAPWSVAGECILAWARCRDRSALPAGLHPLPGPAAVTGVRYTDSPVGPYLELSVSVPARLGLRVGFCVTTMAVTAPEAAAGYRRNWGLPPEVAALRWRVEGDERQLVWEERGVVIQGRPVRPAIPALVPMRWLQHRADGPVLAPRVLFAITRAARVDIAVPDDDDLHWLNGHHVGALMSGMRVLMRPARMPAGVLSSLRAPRWSPEPAMAEGAAAGDPKPVQWRPARALSSVG